MSSLESLLSYLPEEKIPSVGFDHVWYLKIAQKVGGIFSLYDKSLNHADLYRLGEEGNHEYPYDYLGVLAEFSSFPRSYYEGLFKKVSLEKFFYIPETYGDYLLGRALCSDSIYFFETFLEVSLKDFLVLWGPEKLISFVDLNLNVYIFSDLELVPRMIYRFEKMLRYSPELHIEFYRNHDNNYLANYYDEALYYIKRMREGDSEFVIEGLEELSPSLQEKFK